MNKQVRTVAKSTLRRGFLTSSESVEMPSNPMNVSTATDVAFNTEPVCHVLAS